MPLFFGTRKHPKGPNFKTARWLKFDYSGTVFELKVPPNTEDRYTTVIGAPFRNIYDMSNYYEREAEYPKAPQAFIGGHRENWTYRGFPIIDGRLGYLGISIPLLYTALHGNLFHPRNFEAHITSYIDQRYGPGSIKGGGEWGGCVVGPSPCCVVNIHGMEWVNYEVETPHSDKFYSVWSLPITASHVIAVSFDSQEFKQQRYCREAFLETIHQIVSTFKITLSEASLADKREAERQWPDAKYSDSLPEPAWSIANRKAYAARGMM